VVSSSGLLIRSPTIRFPGSDYVGLETLRDRPGDVHLADDARVHRWADASERALRYGPVVTWFERRLEWLRSLDPRVVDGVVAVLLTGVALATVFTQTVTGGLVEPDAFAVVTTVVTCAPLAMRRRAPLLAFSIALTGIFVHVVLDYPEGALPLILLIPTYTVASLSTTKKAVVALGAIYVTIIVLVLTDSAGLDTLGALSNMAIYGVAWAVGIALRARREAVDARMREAEERANLERESTARVLAEERLRIAQELHDVVAHSMSVIAVQAGVGAHVLDDRPDDARVALDNISATSRRALTEMRRLLGVLRDSDGMRDHAPAPGIADVPRLVDEVRAAGVPVTLHVEGSTSSVNPGVELSAYRVVQEALTNVIKHAGAPTCVAVRVQHLPSSLMVEVFDNGRGAAAALAGDSHAGGNGLLGMRERVDVWGGELTAGPISGGGYRVKALLPYGDAE
jgi:signal transduction histidine kinase